jgi:predicted O-methyltransferase YrrM
MSDTPWNPGRLLSLSGSYWQSSALHAGVKLDLFTHIGSNDVTTEDLTQKMSVNQRALSLLLNALCAMGLLRKKAQAYCNSDAGLAFLSKDSDQYIGHMIVHHHNLAPSWARLDEAVRSGKPLRNRSTSSTDSARESFLMGMYTMARTLAPAVVNTIDLSGRKQMLDLGGGPGTYALYFCQRNPTLNATVYDLPTTRPFAEKTIAAFGLNDRVAFQAGDYLIDEIKGAYDVIWISHILHAEGPGDCMKILHKAMSRLSAKGVIIIHDFLLDSNKDGPLFPALFALNMLLGTEYGRAYSEDEITDMLSDAGAVDISRIPFTSPNDSGIIMGHHP